VIPFDAKGSDGMPGADERSGQLFYVDLKVRVRYVHLVWAIRVIVDDAL